MCSLLGEEQDNEYENPYAVSLAGFTFASVRGDLRRLGEDVSNVLERAHRTGLPAVSAPIQPSEAILLQTFEEFADPFEFRLRVPSLSWAESRPRSSSRRRRVRAAAH